ncbi:NAD(P)/FAD-dependent oxidoreductase [Nocardia sp. NPDC051570]|uniref:NAD(P)/FAD-dependent oxidoreductase n=1 Tax=Nocardia sp. NPDC051570 TaxID=3364324 RepID=UPI0037880FD4
MDTEVVVLGAGYAGMSAAKRLSRAGGRLRVTVVNPRRDFVERIRLHQFVAGNHPASRPLRELLPASARLVVDAAVSIDARNRVVHTADGIALGYDYLVFAIGSHGRLDLIPGAAEHAVALDTWEAAHAARQRLHGLSADGTVTVIGGGLTGIETAAELAEQHRYLVRLITGGEIGATLPDRARARLRSYFAAAGVVLCEHATVAEIREGKIVLADGRILDSELTFAATAFTVPGLARTSGLDVDSIGALRVTDSLVSVGDPTIIGAGDAVVLDTPLRRSTQAAVPTGVHAAETVLRLLDGRQPKPVRRKFVGQAVSLGRRNALVQPTDLADRPLARITLNGRLAALAKEQVCRATLHGGQWGPIGYSWS